MLHIKQYKKYMCEQFKLSQDDFEFKDDKELIMELEKQWKKIIKTKEDIIIERIKENNKLLLNKPLSLENIGMSGFVLLITIMLTFSECFVKSQIMAYNILVYFVTIIIALSVGFKTREHVKLRYEYGYHNMCLMILDKIETEFEYKNREEETNKYNERINKINDEVSSIKHFIGIN